MSVFLQFLQETKQVLGFIFKIEGFEPQKPYLARDSAPQRIDAVNALCLLFWLRQSMNYWDFSFKVLNYMLDVQLGILTSLEAFVDVRPFCLASF